MHLPTIALALSIYSGWIALTFFHHLLPGWIVSAGGAWLIAWHSSLQHEILHGHFTRSSLANRLVGFIPLALWLPYERYRLTHLQHHRDESLTDPLDDPESSYLTPEEWHGLPAIAKLLLRAQTTLLGRMLLGPPLLVGRFLLKEARALRCDRVGQRIWAGHLAGVAGVLLWVTEVCRLDLWFYVGLVVYPGIALQLVRSFAEHRAAHGVSERTAVVENAWLLGPLFLFNNLHAAHHENPTVPWYRLPSWYRRNRASIVARNGELVYRSYLDVARRFLLRGHDTPAHPLGRRGTVG